MRAQNTLQKTPAFLAALLLCLSLGLSLAGCAAKKSVRPGKDDTQRVTPAIAQQVLNSAKSQIGRPYRWGGDSPQRGFDCSGLIYWAYKQHGIDVPRQTADQARVGTGVSRRQLRPGDIVVFRASGGLHTGLYAGDGEFIHSPSSRSRVRIEGLEPYWQDRYLTGRRVTYTRPRR